MKTPVNCFLHFLCFSASLYAVTSLNSDGKALLSLLSRWNVTSPAMEATWNASHSSPCSWAGVQCDHSGHQFVVALLLSGYGISGELGPEIANLKYLRSIDLSRNGFFGSIPSEIGSCNLLEELDFESNNFTGEIPENSSLCNLENLEILTLLGNKLSGTIPNCFGNMKKLRLLDMGENGFHGRIPTNFPNTLGLLGLHRNQLEGPLPSSLCKLENLEYLILDGNKLSSTISDTCFWNMSKLSVLDLRDNEFQGMIPTKFPDGSALTNIGLKGNHLEGPLPHSLCKLESLEFLRLAYNKLNGTVHLDCFRNMSNLTVLDLGLNGFRVTIPTNVSNSKALSVLYLDGCQLQGPLPPLCKLENLNQLALSDNKLTGTIPDCFWNMTEITLLDFGDNTFHGTIPTNFPKGLGFLGLYNNQLEGPLPPSLCELENLDYLLTFDNKLNATIPECIWNMSKLKALDLAGNGFHGMIAAKFPKGSALRSLRLNGNQLEGRLPKSLLNCRSLGILDLGRNNINDTFPAWLGALPELTILSLKGNHLHGTVGLKSNTSFQKLRILDISFNQFSGSLQADMMESFQAMKKIDNLTQLITTGQISYYQDFSTFVIKGLELDLRRVSTIFAAIDFSANCFEGRIPTSIGELKSLKALNFSHNQFEGVIPSTIGDMSALESLDLSWNRLSGNIPAELANLNFLSTLNLSQNQLAGRIPTGRQLSTFSNYSYGGNPGLCGFPLGECGRFPQSPSSHHQHDDMEFIDGLTWESVLLGFGCGLILGLLTGGLMFYIEKPKWFHAIIEDMCKQLKRQRKERLNWGKIN